MKLFEFLTKQSAGQLSIFFKIIALEIFFQMLFVYLPNHTKVTLQIHDLLI